MTLLILGIALMAAGGVLAAALGKSEKLPANLALAGQAAALVLGLPPCWRVFSGGQAEFIYRAWPVPGGSLALRLDALSAFFLLLILFVVPLAGLFGHGYLSSKTHPRRAAWSWLFFNLLSASMCLVVLADNAVFFLGAWEGMAVASYFLVTFEHERPEVRKAGWIYLVATHCGTASLLALFALLSTFARGSLDFAAFHGSLPSSSAAASACFVLALVGFGVKAGFVPFYAWLPEAHPAAPSHVSAVMSGLMIKTGIYALLRVLLFLGPVQAWWGWVLLLLGLLGALLGVSLALVQTDLKRLLAFSSVENIGLISLSLGLGLLGLAGHEPTVAALGFLGVLLHTANHALFKSLLFLGAGSVLHAAGTREMERLGGLMKRMPITGALFLAGVLAISGLPPFNGFIGEFFMFLGGFKSLLAGQDALQSAGAVVIGGLALVSGLAGACFVRAFSMVFLGRPRSVEAEQAHEPGLIMILPLAILAAACLGLGLAAFKLVGLLAPALGVLADSTPGLTLGLPDFTAAPLRAIAVLGGSSLVLVLALSLARRWLLSGRKVLTRVPTWDCGYILSVKRNQYSASSFSQPFVRLFGTLVRALREGKAVEGYFPTESAFSVRHRELFGKALYQQAFQSLQKLALMGRGLQEGRVHLYVLYIALTLVALLLWKLL